MALNPQQTKFKEAYLDPKSPTFGNALRSALEAGYSDEYAKNITGQGNEWFSEIIRDKEMIDSAERALKETIEMQVLDEKGKTDTGLSKVRLDAVKFVLPALKRQKWQAKNELDITTGGQPISLNISFPNGSESEASSEDSKPVST